MKKLFCILGIAAMCFAGCDNESDDDNNGGNNSGDNNGSANSGDNSGSGNSGDNSGSANNDLNFNGICAGIYAESWDFSSLDADKKSQLDAAFKKDCLASYEKLSVCKSELYNELKCLYVDTPASAFEPLKDREEACYEQYSDPDEREECVDNVWKDSPCYNVQVASAECYEKNEAAYEAWAESEDANGFSSFYGLLEQWALAPDDYGAED